MAIPLNLSSMRLSSKRSDSPLLINGNLLIVGLAALTQQSSALKIVPTKKRSSKLGVFSYCTIYS